MLKGSFKGDLNANKTVISESLSMRWSDVARKIVNKKRKWDQVKEHSTRQVTATPSPKSKSCSTINNKKPPIDGGEVRTTSSVGHNCPINVLCAALFGESTADEVRPFRTNLRIAWCFVYG